MKNCVHLYFALSILLGKKNVLDKTVEKIKTPILFFNLIPENRASMIYGKIRYSHRPHMTIRHMSTVCLITKAARARTHTHRMRYTYCFSTATMVTHTRLNFTFIRTMPVFTQRLHKINYL